MQWDEDKATRKSLDLPHFGFAVAMLYQVELLLKTAIKRIVRGKGGVLVFHPWGTGSALSSCKNPTTIDQPFKMTSLWREYDMLQQLMINQDKSWWIIIGETIMLSYPKGKHWITGAPQMPLKTHPLATQGTRGHPVLVAAWSKIWVQQSAIIKVLDEKSEPNKWILI